jgi:hypothetical protein
MRRPKLPIKVVAVSLGSLGTALCLALIVLSWIAGNRLRRATEGLFGSAERALIAVQQRVIHAHEQVSAATEAAADIENSLLEWIKREASQRQVLQLDVTGKTERLASTLQQADLWLEVAESSLGLVREALASDTVASPPAKTEVLDRLIEDLASLRAQLTEAAEIVDKVHERLTGPISESLEARIEQGRLFTRRVAAKLSSINARVGMVEERLSAAHTQVRDLGARAQRWILVAEIAVTVFLLWMAAGQLAFCLLAWIGSDHRQR